MRHYFDSFGAAYWMTQPTPCNKMNRLSDWTTNLSPRPDRLWRGSRDRGRRSVWPPCHLPAHPRDLTSYRYRLSDWWRWWFLSVHNPRKTVINERERNALVQHATEDACCTRGVFLHDGELRHRLSRDVGLRHLLSHDVGLRHWLSRDVGLRHQLSRSLTHRVGMKASN